MPVSGGAAQRVTFAGTYNVSPALSLDGRWLSFVSRGANGYRVHLMDLSNDKVTSLTESSQDEKPSFAPNSKLIMYATKVSSREVLMTTTLDGKIGTRLAGQSANIREPHWGPFLKP